MSNIKILHNNRCSKSRNAVNLLTEKGIEFEIVNYLDNVLSENDIQELLNKLQLEPEDIIRKKEAIFKENFKGKSFTEAEWITILQQNPKLIERPILYNEKAAVVGRPIENVEEFLNNLK